MVGAAQLLMRIVRSACFCIHAAFIQEGFVPHQPVMQALDKAVFAATRQRQRKRPQLACRLTFRLFGQVADDDLELVKLAHLHRNIGEGLQQPAASVADIVKSLTKSNKDKEPKQQGIHISQPPLFPQPLDPCPGLLYRVEIRAIRAEATAPYVPQNVFIVPASAVNYRHEQKNLPKRYQSRAICASPSPAGKCP